LKSHEEISTTPACGLLIRITRYLDAELKAALADSSDVIWCLSESCKSGQIHTEGDMFTCTACGFKSCVNCEVAWHGGETCENYQSRTKAEVLKEKDKTRQSQVNHKPSFLTKLKTKLRIGNSSRVARKRAAKAEAKRKEAEKTRQRLEQEESASDTLLKERTKACPSCGRKTEKEG
jgi:hypothetical protein